MAQDVTSIYNIALSLTGINSPVSAPTERSPEAEICTTHYELTRNYVFGMAHWPELKGFNSMALLASRTDGVAWTAGDPEPGWKYSYAFPSNCIRPRFLADYSSFTTGGTDDARHLYTNSQSPILIFTEERENAQNWSNDLYMAVIYALAAAIARQSTGKRALANDLNVKADNIVRQMRANSANEEYTQVETLPDWITVRGFSNIPTTRFFYPLNSYLATSNGLIK